MNSPAPHQGKVFSYKQFPFGDGGQSDKLLIVINEPDSFSDYIFVKTTSQPKCKDTQGCHCSHNLYVLNPGEDLFPKKTWVQFHELYPIPRLAMDAATKYGEAKRIGQLRPQTVAAILNCMKKSEDLSPRELSFLK
ncbi:MAG: hypothetical protein KGZ82_03660 [Bacteroidales bacterium]|nr:hypothetical protein [Bacteroidales bacterium]